MESEKMNILHEKYSFHVSNQLTQGKNPSPVHYSMVQHCYINKRKCDEVIPHLWMPTNKKLQRSNVGGIYGFPRDKQT